MQLPSRSDEPLIPGDPDGGWYHIPGGGKDFFKVDTWLLFDAAQELSAAELVKLKLESKIRVAGKLRGDIANAICNCMRNCDDVSEYQKDIAWSSNSDPEKILVLPAIKASSML